ncbi:AcvB/VirJ family lysyl-phosphatidylglycerol hydrolase [Sphingomonas sp. RS6]
MPNRLRNIAQHWRRALATLAALLVAAAGGVYWTAGFFDRDPVHLYGMPPGVRARVAAVFMSGDMGMRYGMGAYVAKALAGSGVPVYAIASSTAFVHHRSRADVDAMLADAIRQAMARTGADKVIVIGQSFGADMVRVGMTSLPAALRPHVPALVLVVPGATAYFRADPLGFAYTGKPDADAAEAKALDWLPVTCIRGAKEPDSLCPHLTMPNVRRITLPGGHYLRADHDLLVRTVLSELGPVLTGHSKATTR